MINETTDTRLLTNTCAICKDICVLLYSKLLKQQHHIGLLPVPRLSHKILVSQSFRKKASVWSAV